MENTESLFLTYYCKILPYFFPFARLKLAYNIISSANISKNVMAFAVSHQRSV